MSMICKKRIIIAEDHAIIRDGLKAIFVDYPEFEVVGEAADGLEAIRLCAKLTPDLLLLDFSMPKMNGVEAIADIKKQSPRTKILMLTVHSSVEHVATALQAGANGYASKNAKQADLLQAVRLVLQGKRYIAETVAEHYEAFNSGAAVMSEESKLVSVLTKREKEVLKLVAEGYTSKEIGSLLYISSKTVENHRANVMIKLDLHTLQALTVYALHIGLVE